MVNQDFGFKIKQLSGRVAEIEEFLGKLKMGPNISDTDWDNARLMQEWGICKRTSANYRQRGLESFKRGGLIYYSPDSRLKFITTKNALNHGK